MFLREDYVNGKVTHRDYYGQFVTPEAKAIVITSIPVELLIASTDRHFNDIPLQEWDRMPAPRFLNEKMKRCGDYLTLAGKVCILKEAARQIVEDAAKRG